MGVQQAGSGHTTQHAGAGKPPMNPGSSTQQVNSKIPTAISQISSLIQLHFFSINDWKSLSA
jgi:hypothetical protein